VEERVTPEKEQGNMSPPPKANQVAWDVGQMAHRMAEGYYTHLAVIQTTDVFGGTPKGIELSGTVDRKEGVPEVFKFLFLMVRSRRSSDQTNTKDRSP
jgi:hypothetical protein